MKNKLTEQQLQAQLLAEFDAINKLGRGIGRVAGSAAKGVGAVAGGVAGLGSAVKKGYQAGKQTVGGGGANVNKGQTKQQKAPGKFDQTMNNLVNNIGTVALDTAAGSGYDYRKGVNPNPTGVGAGLQKADAEAQRKAGLEKKLGTTGTQATATNTAKTAVDKSIARNQKKKDKQSAMKQGIDQAKNMANFFLQNHIEHNLVLSSEWCRCMQTAKYAFRNYKTKSFLNSFFSQKFSHNKNNQIKELKEYINKWNGKGNLIFVTHYVVILEILNLSVSSGEIVVVDKDFNILVRQKTFNN